MIPLFAGLVEGAIIGAAVGLVLGIIMMFIPGKPCPQCKKPLPKPLFGPVKACPKCGCKLNSKGEKIEEDEGR